MGRSKVFAGTNRIGSLLLSVHPALELALGGNAAHPALLALLGCRGGPTGPNSAGHKSIDTVLAKKAPRMQAALAERIWSALGEQTVVVAGTAAVETILPQQASALVGPLAWGGDRRLGGGGSLCFCQAVWGSFCW